MDRNGTLLLPCCCIYPVSGEALSPLATSTLHNSSSKRVHRLLCICTTAARIQHESFYIDSKTLPSSIYRHAMPRIRHSRRNSLSTRLLSTSHM